MTSSVPLGFGLGLREPHYSWTLQHRPQLDWFEAVTENFIGSGGKPRRYLEQVRKDYPVALHGVGLSIASVDRPNLKYLADLRQLASEIDAICVSDHLCWTRHMGQNSHDLLPIAFTEGVLEHVISRVQEVQERLGRRLFLENASAYVSFACADMDESEFLAALCQATGCGVLLDVNNLYVNKMNLGVNTQAYLSRIDPEWICYMHLAGHSVLPKVRVDTHDAPVCDMVWDLYGQAAQLFPKAATLLEWDGQIPAFEDLRAELSKAEAVHAAALQTLARPVLPTLTMRQPAAATSRQREWPELVAGFWRMATSQCHVAPEDETLDLVAKDLATPAVVGMNVYADAYLLRLQDALCGIYPSVLYVLGKARFLDLVRDFLAVYPPSEASIKYVGRALAGYLRYDCRPLLEDDGLSNQLLADLAEFEWTTSDLIDCHNGPPSVPASALTAISASEWEQVRFSFTDCLRLVQANYAVAPVIFAIDCAEAPEKPPKGDFHYLFYRQNEVVSFLELAPPEACCFNLLQQGGTFSVACAAAAELTPDTNQEHVIATMVHCLHQWLRVGLIVDILGCDAPVAKSSTASHEKLAMPANTGP
jgi:hypothetical protein